MIDIITGIGQITDQQLDQYRNRMDPLADEAVAALMEDKSLLKTLMQRLPEKDPGDLNAYPAAVRSFLEQTNQLPAWTDPKKLEVAHQLFLDHGPTMMMFLYYKSLPVLYACQYMAKVIYQTGRLAYNPEDDLVFRKRIAETSQFLVDVMGKDALKSGGIGIRAIQKVRLVHALVRHGLLKQDWDDQTYGMPVNQEDMAGTLMTFGIVISDALARFGVYEPHYKHEAYSHLWSAVGALLGVNENLLPGNRSQAQYLFDRIVDRQAAYSKQGRALIQALIHFAKISMPNRFLKETPETLIRYLVGSSLSRKLGIDEPKGLIGNVFPGVMKMIARHTENFKSSPLNWRQFLRNLTINVTAKMKEGMDETGVVIRITPEMEEAWK